MSQSFVCENPKEFQHIIRVQNTNIIGKRVIVNALTVIRGVGRRLAHAICKVANVDTNARAGTIKAETWELISKIISNPEKYSIPEWFFNRRRDFRDGVDMHASTNVLETKIREDLERMKKSRRHRGLRHHWLLKVRGQHTNSTGRRGVMIGVVRKQQRDK